MTKTTSTNAKLSEFDAYVALAWMIINYGHVDAIPDEATSDDASTSPSETASDDTQVRGGEGLGRGMVLGGVG